MEPKFRISNKCILFLSFVVVVAWASPLWLTPGKTGVLDWGHAMHRCEVLRRTILGFKQWPGNNPWSMGGLPLLGNPAVNIISVKGLFVLPFGTFWGLRLVAVAYLFIGFWGAWKLSGIWWKDQFIRMIFCLYIVANPAMISHVTVGHLAFQTFYFFPLVFYYILRFKEDSWSGLKAAIVVGLAFNDSPSYIVQYGVLILICLYIYLYLSNYKDNSRMLLRWLVLFVPVVAAFTFYRIVTILQIAFDYSRIIYIKNHYDLLSIFKVYLVPYTKLTKIFSSKSCNTTWEACCYVGIIAFLLTCWSFKRGFRWWHMALIMLVWAGIGNDSYLHIMYWIRKIPSFSSHISYTRIRVFTYLFFGIAATCGLNALWTKYGSHTSRKWRYIPILVGLVMVAEVLTVSHMIMKSSHVKVPFEVPYNTENKFQNIRSLSYQDKLPNLVSRNYGAIKMNLGWLGGSGDTWIPSAGCVRLARGDPEYVAEFHQAGSPVEPAYWSPNRILLEDLDPNVPLIVNKNPGNPWYCNGEQLFSGYRIVELDKPFEVMPDSNGRIELCYKYPGQRLGLVGTAVFAIISILVITYAKKHRHDKILS